MKHIMRIIGVATLVIFVGCASRGPLPRGARVVGGGFQIDWDAPSDGTAILVEAKTGRTVATKSVSLGGGGFKFDGSSRTDADLLIAIFADRMPTNAQLVLYFVPTGTNR